jgi:hypothetical protein
MHRSQFESSFAQKPALFNKFWSENPDAEAVISVSLKHCSSWILDGFCQILFSAFARWAASGERFSNGPHHEISSHFMEGLCCFRASQIQQVFQP